MSSSGADFPGYKYLGCFNDGASRLLDAAYQGSSSMTPAFCGTYCNGISSGRFYPFIGVEAKNQCYCGTQYARDEGQENDEGCNEKCAGNSNLTCGGEGYINVYSATAVPTGITLSSTSSTRAISGNTSPTVTATVTITRAPLTTSSIPSDKTPAVIGLSVITALFGLALLGVLGVWFLRRRKRGRQSIPQIDTPRAQDAIELKYPSELHTDEPIPELVDTGVRHSPRN